MTTCCIRMGDSPDFSAMGVDHEKWAEAFCERFPGNDRSVVEEWFRRAMDEQHHELTGYRAYEND